MTVSGRLSGEPSFLGMPTRGNSEVPRRSRSSQSKVLESRSRERRESPSPIDETQVHQQEKSDQCDQAATGQFENPETPQRGIHRHWPAEEEGHQQWQEQGKDQGSRFEKTYSQCATIALQANPCPAHQLQYSISSQAPRQLPDELHAARAAWRPDIAQSDHPLPNSHDVAGRPLQLIGS